MRRSLVSVVLLLAIAVMLVVTGCVPQQPAAQPEKLPPSQQQAAVQQPTPSGCDGFCDSFEQQHKDSPCYKPDCLGIKETQPFCGDGVCDDEERRTGGCSDCGSSDLQKLQQPDSQQQQPPPQQPSNQQPPAPVSDSVTVKPLSPAYRAVASKPSSSGWLSTGQEADILLSGIGFNNAGGPLLFNHPGAVASDGEHLLLADRNNNRVLVWNKLPTANNTPPDLVLGQSDFYSNNPGAALDKMNWPVSVAASGGKVVVTDTFNDRLLIWNSFPTRSGQPADLVINDARGPGKEKRTIFWPWAVWTDGNKLVMASTRGSLVLIWNAFPTQNDQAADIYLTASGKFGTPRTIGSDGKHLVIGDHNAKTIDGSGTFFWKAFPTSDDQPYDFFMGFPDKVPDPTKEKVAMMGVAWGPTFTSDGGFWTLTSTLNKWTSFPQDENDEPDLIMGSTGPAAPGYYFEGGDGSGIAYVNSRMYVSLTNGNKLVGFNSLPDSEKQEPDFVIGSPDLKTNTLQTNFIISNPKPATDGNSLFVASDFDRKLYVWKSLPDESNAYPDFVYDFFGKSGNVNFQASAIAINSKSLALIGTGPGGQEIYAWSELPLNGELPDLHFTGTVGGIELQELKGMALDDKYFYLSDSKAGKVYAWEGLPNGESSPDVILDVQSASGLSSDGAYLLVDSGVPGNDRSIRVYSVASLSPASQHYTLSGKIFDQSILFVAKGRLFTTSTGYNRVLAWKSVEDALAGRSPDVILGDRSMDNDMPEIGKDKLFWPQWVAFDGSYLWVGETKFSERLLRFSVH